MEEISILNSLSINELLTRRGIDQSHFDQCSPAEKMKILMDEDRPFKEAVLTYQNKHPEVTDEIIYDEMFCEPFSSMDLLEDGHKVPLWVVISGLIVIILMILFVLFNALEV